MSGIKHSMVCISRLLCSISGLAHVKPKADEARGALPYDTQCNLHNTSEFHALYSKLATRRANQKIQISRWQDII